MVLGSDCVHVSGTSASEFINLIITEASPLRILFTISASLIDTHKVQRHATSYESAECNESESGSVAFNISWAFCGRIELKINKL